jgi:hypothetical protein
MTFEPESAHHAHDPLLVSGHASGELAAADTARVERWIRDCSACAAIHVDVLSISGALAALPKTARAPRDFRLSPAQAARLRGGSWWRRLGRSLVAPRGLGRPLATAFTTLGLVGLLVGNLSPGFLSQAGGASPEYAPVGARVTDSAPVPVAAPSPQDTSSAYAPDDAEGRANALSGSGASPSVMKDDLGTTGPPTTESPASSGDADLFAGGPTSGRDSTSPTSLVIALAIAFLSIGIGLFAVRRLGGRFA